MSHRHDERGSNGRFKSKVEKFAETSVKPKTGEVGSAGTSVLGSMSFMAAVNPDLLVGAKGLEIYQTMVDREPYIKAALMQKKTSLLSVDWGIIAASSNDIDLEVAELCRYNLKEYLESNFSYDMYEMLDALDTGYSILEKIWSVIVGGPFAGKWGYSQFKAKDPQFFSFDLDEFGNIRPDGLLMNVQGQETRLPMDKFFHFAFNKRYEDPYGRSDLRSVYRAYWLKDTAWKLRAIYMERYSGNNLKGTYPPNAKDGKAELLRIFRDWSQQTGLALPKGYEVDVMTLATSSSSEYERSINDLNKEILIGILGVTLTVDEGKLTGARALGEVHKDVADLFVLFLEIQLKSEIQRQIIKPLVDVNYPNIFTYPKFVFNSRDTLSPQEVQVLKQAGVKIPEDWIREQFNIPQPEEAAAESTPQIFQYHIENGVVTPNEVRTLLGFPPLKGGDDPLQKVPTSADAFSEAIFPEFNTATALIKLREHKVINEYMIETFSELEDKTHKFADLSDPNQLNSRIVPEKTILEPGNYWRPLNQYEKYAEVTSLDETLRKLEEAAVQASRPAYEDIRKGIASWTKRTGILNKSNQAAALRLVSKMPVNVGEFKKVLEKSTFTDDMLGRFSQVREMKNQGQDFSQVKKFREDGTDRNIIKLAESPLDINLIDKPLDVSEIVSLFSGRIPMTRTEFDQLTTYHKDRAFTVAGLEQIQIEKDIQPLLIRAIDEGWSEDKFLFELGQQFTKYVTPEFANVGSTSSLILDFHAQTVFRNAMMSSFNRARNDFRQQPELLRTFPGSLYSAILDGRETKICRDLDGKKFLASNPAWIPWYPQNHHRCRSMLISINFVDFNPDEIDPVPTSVVLPFGFGG